MLTLEHVVKRFGGVVELCCGAVRVDVIAHGGGGAVVGGVAAVPHAVLPGNAPV